MTLKAVVLFFVAFFSFGGAYFLRRTSTESAASHESSMPDDARSVVTRMPTAVVLPFYVEFLWQRSDAAAEEGRLWDMARDLETLIEIEPWVATSRLFLAQVLAFNVAPFEPHATQRFSWYARSLEVLDRGRKIGLEDPTIGRLEFRILAEKMAKDPAFSPRRSLPDYRRLLDRALDAGKRHVAEFPDDPSMRFSTIEVAMLAAAASLDLFDVDRADADLLAALRLFPTDDGPFAERFGRFRRSVESWRALIGVRATDAFSLDEFLRRERERASEIVAASDERLGAIETVRSRALIDWSFESMRRAFADAEIARATTSFDRWRALISLDGKSTRGIEVAAWREMLSVDSSLMSQSAAGGEVSENDRSRFWAAVARLGRLPAFRFVLTSDDQARLVAGRDFLRVK